jgi:hypothetical protein
VINTYEDAQVNVTCNERKLLELKLHKNGDGSRIIDTFFQQSTPNEYSQTHSKTFTPVQWKKYLKFPLTIPWFDNQDNFSIEPPDVLEKLESIPKEATWEPSIYAGICYNFLSCMTKDRNEGQVEVCMHNQIIYEISLCKYWCERPVLV